MFECKPYLLLLYEPRPLVGEDPITIRLEGVDYMDNDPSQVKVLYAKVYDGSGKYIISFNIL